jgi:hypothetical protein
MRSVLTASIFVVSIRASWASSASIGEDGINSLSLGLDGTGVLIGQVEDGRSGKQGYDGDGFASPNTFPTGVYFGEFVGMDDPNDHVETHATEVAQVMIGKLGPGDTGAAWEGVDPNAQLHSIAIASSAELAFNRAATLNGGLVRAINYSAGQELDFFEEEDGNSHLTQFVDWSASFHDVVYVVAWGNVDSPELRKPQDNFNGITVAASEPTEDDLGVYKRYAINVNASSGDAAGDRTSIDLIAPGKDIRLLEPINDEDVFRDGTSFATPHVTGAVALLQQYSQRQMDSPIFNPRFTVNSQRHEVMKSILLNSADKLNGVHGSKRTVVDGSNLDWTQSEAFNSQFISLDNQMGAGALNVGRAVQQFSSGEYAPGTVPLIGWDYGSIGGSDAIQEYYFDRALDGDKYIAITLTWDRKVTKTSPGGYNEGDDFFHYTEISQVLNNLDVYLMPAASNDLVNDSIWSSRSFEDNVEHIFFNDFDTGTYKIVVKHNAAGTLGTSQNYALAWWFGDTLLPGDYNKNGSVGPEDYQIWRASFGTSNASADGNGNGVVDAADYVVWRNNLSAPGSGSAAAIPEGSSTMLLVVGCALSCLRRSTLRRSSG